MYVEDKIEPGDLVSIETDAWPSGNLRYRLEMGWPTPLPGEYYLVKSVTEDHILLDEFPDLKWNRKVFYVVQSKIDDVFQFVFDH